MANQSNKTIISGLVGRRRDLKAKADYHSRESSLLQSDIAALDKAIHIIEPAFDLSTIKPTRLNKPPKYTIDYQIAVIKLLRDSGRAWTVAEIATEWQKRNSQALSQKDRHKLRDRIKNFLYRQVEKGFIAKNGAKFRLNINQMWDRLGSD